MCRIAAPVFAFLLLVAPAVGTADALPDTIRVIDEGSGLEPDYVPGLIGQAAREYEKLKVLFHNDVGVVTIRLRANGPARHLPPADIVIPAPRVRDGRAVTAHEITHLLNQGWANGLLKEGLAVWAQDRVGEQAGWPNEGRLIHQVARAAITEADPLVRGPSDRARASVEIERGCRIGPNARIFRVKIRILEIWEDFNFHAPLIVSCGTRGLSKRRIRVGEMYDGLPSPSLPIRFRRTSTKW